MGRYTTHRTDSTAKALIAYAESLGFVYMDIGGIVDGLLAYGQKVVVVDWKAEGGELTKNQQKLVARGFPIRFISSPQQLDAMKVETT